MPRYISRASITTALAWERAAADGEFASLLGADLFEFHKGGAAGGAGVEDADFDALAGKPPEQLHDGFRLPALPAEGHQHRLKVGGEDIKADLPWPCPRGQRGESGLR